MLFESIWGFSDTPQAFPAIPEEFGSPNFNSCNKTIYPGLGRFPSPNERHFHFCVFAVLRVDFCGARFVDTISAATNPSSISIGCAVYRYKIDTPLQKFENWRGSLHRSMYVYMPGLAAITLQEENDFEEVKPSAFDCTRTGACFSTDMGRNLVTVSRGSIFPLPLANILHAKLLPPVRSSSSRSKSSY